MTRQSRWLLFILLPLLAAEAQDVDVPLRAILSERAPEIWLDLARVEKMASSACAARVTKVLQQLDGVRDAKVDVKAKGAVVEYDPTKLTPQQLVGAVTTPAFASACRTRGRMTVSLKESSRWRLQLC